MPQPDLSLARLSEALGLPEQSLLALVANCDKAADATRVALTVEEAARRLGVGRTTMYGLVSSGEVPSVMIGRLRRIPAKALSDYIAARVGATGALVA
ncbi:helix-turn-helix domain-containing protein [Streptomyces kaniharaensis]|uniref:Helix-turn-helix domain-containing protein n=1 Tax=Streptomyces kaniharaensis TaxID=212423 RepID=A0A6N7KS11_9ACTN|nr:helix-turn-helix domain-containing protein [Streptomyces kaniharaensis]MQS13379.1 helix-turn-helix domain-containing protein [Streptomyces kaniharaensis]